MDDSPTIKLREYSESSRKLSPKSEIRQLAILSFVKNITLSELGGGAQIDSESIQNRFKIDSESIQNRFRIDSEKGAQTCFERFLKSIQPKFVKKH